MMRKMSAALVGLLLVPTLALAAVVEGTIVKMSKTQIVVQTDKGEQLILLVASNTKGLENAKEGAKVKIDYSKKGDQMVASEISSTSPSSAPEGRSLPPPLR